MLLPRPLSASELAARVGAALHGPDRVVTEVAPADLAALTDDDLRVTLGMNALMDRKRFRAMVASLEAPAGPVPSIDESGVTRLHVAHGQGLHGGCGLRLGLALGNHGRC
jgi:hypothetical protein